MEGFGPHARSPAELAASRRLRGSGTPFLELRDGDGRQRLVALEGEKLSIGRAEGCGVAVPWDPEVSRLHAVVERIDGVWVLEDAGSRNGTAVDGEPVTGRRLLRDGAVISAGRTQILFQCTSPTDAARTEAAVAVPVPELTAAQRRVLAELCRPWLSGASASPASNARTSPRRWWSRRRRSRRTCGRCSPPSTWAAPGNTRSAPSWPAARSPPGSSAAG